jgi:hypothetical protein
MIHTMIGRFGAIRSLLLFSLFAIWLVVSRAGQDRATAPVTASFQGLGQMPGVVIQPGVWHASLWHFR